MEKVVYLLGAGFSAPLDLPVMSNFLLKAKDMYALDAGRYAHFEKIFTTIDKMSVAKSYYESDLFNIEEILSILEMKAYLDGNDNSDAFTKFIADVITYCTPDIQLQLTAPLLQFHRWHNYIFGNDVRWSKYGYFIANILNLKIWVGQINNICVGSDKDANTKYSIITVNYDMIPEKIRGFLAKNYKPISNEPLKQLCIAKLHGSIEPLKIVPPTWNKIANKELIDCWKVARVELQNANHIRIIGYSLPLSDSYIKYLLKASILEARHLKTIDVICLDGTGEVRKRYDDFIKFNFYKFKNARVEDYLAQNHGFHLQKFESSAQKDQPLIFNGLEDAHNTFMDESPKIPVGQIK